MEQSTSRNLFLAGIILSIIATVLFVEGSNAAAAATTSPDGTVGSAPSLGIMLIIAFALYAIGCILATIAWIGALINTARLGQWLWFILLLVLSWTGIIMLVYIFAQLLYIKKDIVTRQCPNCGGFKTSPGISKRRYKAEPIIYTYSCYLCGNNWAWQEGTAYPSVTVNPALIRTSQAYLDQQAAMYYEMERQRRLRTDR